MTGPAGLLIKGGHGLPFTAYFVRIPLKRFASVFVLFALVLGACSEDGLGLDFGASNDTAATVDGTVITVGDVETLINSDTDVVDKDTFARFLGAAIQIEIMGTAAEEEFGITISEDEIEAEADRIYEDNAIDQTREEFLAAAGISEAMLSEIAYQQLLITAIEEQLVAEPTEEQMEEARRRAAWSVAEVCASHILVATEEEAADVLDRLGAGEDFADLAAELSTDTVSGAEGGDLGCAPPARYVEDFAEATMTVELNTPSDPVESTYGFHIILVTDRTEADPADIPSDEELLAQLGPALAEAAFGEWYTTVMTDAEVVVEPEFGTWTTDPSPTVIAPTTDTTQPGTPDTTAP